MRSLAKAFDIVKNTGDRDSSLNNGATLKRHLELLELALIWVILRSTSDRKLFLRASLPGNKGSSEIIAITCRGRHTEIRALHGLLSQELNNSTE